MNMLRPSITQILRNNESPYSLVVGVAKRAREITDDAERDKKVLVDKPVKLAVEEFASGKVKLVECENIGLNIEE